MNTTEILQKHLVSISLDTTRSKAENHAVFALGEFETLLQRTPNDITWDDLQKVELHLGYATDDVQETLGGIYERVNFRRLGGSDVERLARVIAQRKYKRDWLRNIWLGVALAVLAAILTYIK